MSHMSYLDIETIRAQAPSVFATQAHHTRSSKYTFLPTIDAVVALQNEGFQVAAVKQSRTRMEDRRSFTRHMVRMRAPGLGNEEFTPEVVITNAHDGGGAFKCFGGGFRAFCFNGMIVAEGRIECITIPHRGEVLADVLNGAMTVMNHARAIGEVVPVWRGIDLSMEAQLEFAQRALELRWVPGADGAATTPIARQQLLEVRREADRGSDLWHVYNRVQEAVMVGGMEYTSVTQNSGRTKIRHLKARPIRGVNQDVMINRSLWQLAEEFAAAA